MTEPEPYSLRNGKGDLVLVTSPFDEATVTLIAEGVDLTPDQADEVAAALKAHAAARRLGSFFEAAEKVNDRHE